MQSFQDSHLYTRLRDTIWTPSQGNSRKSVKWIDGLRGIASFLVVLTHLARAWDYDLFSPRDNEDVPPRVLQWPVLRIPWQGRIGVTIFAFLTGYVCALKPLKLARAGEYLGAFKAIAKSAFRRPPRLILPATIALLISWTMAQFGAFVVANRSDCWWCRYAAPDLEDSLSKEVVRLGENFLSTWTTGYMAYDDHQWALLPLLKASMLVYILVSATMYVRFRWRVVVYFLLIAYFHQDASKDTETFQIQAIYGTLLSDLTHHTPFQALLSSPTHRWPRRLILLLLTTLGLYLASYPGEHPEYSPWSNSLLTLSPYIFPPEVNIGKRYTAIGVDLLIAAIFLSPSTQHFLSNRLLLWLGKQSFAVYLVHGTLLRTVLCWVLYGTITGEPWEEGVDENGAPVLPPYLPLMGPWVVGLGMVGWVGLVYGVAVLWTGWVDPACERLTGWVERKVGVRGEDGEKGEGNGNGNGEGLPLPLPMQMRPMAVA
ncbi:hypothetical protein BO70DRAFT_429815 [Aspergillus heteromorphus CBS 117.55]|uniref:Acyltransferase 3 domain-containing protein n=1 Tax=Aspergillus heteromorphus CBS 117.55 TaxID=1448321 RepID=A0A317W3B0_9EURO|nr:uncharacterized protein BO70DRAFT_429815 [Aspergillus heteromorphus CBS 117.55]PWY79608.1 hypothetical protein BO70DRAFT_429815 [Aspergillus heteromorphus CBS 117.55]